MGIPKETTMVKYGLVSLVLTLISIYLFINLEELFEEKNREDLRVIALDQYQSYLDRYGKGYAPDEFKIRQQIYIDNHYFAKTFRGHNVKLNHMADWTQEQIDAVLTIKQSFQGVKFEGKNEIKPVYWNISTVVESL